MQAIEMIQVRKDIKGNELFKIEHLSVKAGEQIGIVGKNGAGKSTLLNILAGEDTAYSGQLTVRGSYAYVRQMKAESTLSGGEQTFQALQQAIYSGSSILLLDEPTSNLDVKNVENIQTLLQEYQGTLIMVSHDRAFLNQTVNTIWELDGGKITEYIGNYDAYYKEKEAELEQQAAAYEHYQKEVQRLEREAADRLERAQHFKARKGNMSASEYKVSGFMGRYDAQEKSLAKTGKALQKRLDRLEKVEAPPKEKRFLFQAVGHLNQEKKTLLNLEENSIQVAGRELFSLRDFKVVFGDKIAINGPNKAGKTTFLRAIIGGKLAGYYSSALSIGYFSQNLSVLKADKTIIENIQEHSLQDRYTINQVLASLGFDYSRLDQEVASLSGGERVRLSFAKVILADHNLLLLDEPTNYLDITTLEAVEDFIKEYPGAIVLVSHDQRFVEATTDRSYYIEEGQLLSETYKEDYQDQCEQQIQLLEYRLDEMIMDPDASLDDIRNLQKKIRELKGKM